MIFDGMGFAHVIKDHIVILIKICFASPFFEAYAA